MEDRLDAIFSEYASGAGPGLVTGVSLRGQPAYRHAFGRSSIENGAANTLRTRMRIGSSTKQFTCFGVLLLAEDGLLSIDDDIRKHLPELPGYSSPVRIRQLMSNSSGVRCYLDLIGLLGGLQRTVPAPLQVELQLHQQSMNFAPGERLLYCNGGYLLLSMLIERVAGMPLGAFFSQRIFQPLGLLRTVFEPYDTRLLDDVATLHQRFPDDSYHRGTLGIPLCGDGAIISDVDDVLRWLDHMDSPSLGNADTWQTFLSAGSETSHGYGFGLMHLKYRGIDTIQHGGTVFGGRCQALKVPSHGINIIMMSNASDVLSSELTDRMLDVLLEGSLSQPLQVTSAERAQRFTGTFYSSQTGDAVTILTKDDRAFVDLENGHAPLYDTADGEGLRTNMYSLGFEVRPASSDNGDAVRAIELSQGGFRAVLQRVNGAEGSAAGDMSAYKGTYENRDCDAEAVVRNDGGLRLCIRSRYGSAEYRLEPLCGYAWYARLEYSPLPSKVRVEFAPAPETSVFYISSERTKRLAFTRT